MNIINIIKEEIDDFMDGSNDNQLNFDTSISLENAQRYYGSLVPWILDKTDLRIINALRNKYFLEREKTIRTTYNTQQESVLSNLYSNHIIEVREALWKKAQTQK